MKLVGLSHVYKDLDQISWSYDGTGLQRTAFRQDRENIFRRGRLEVARQTEAEV